jgi:hypothetical protein
MKNNGANPFYTNSLSRKLGKEQEVLRYQKEQEQLDLDVARMSREGITIDPNDLSSIREDMEAIHNLNLSKINSEFKTMGDTLNDLARTSLQSLSTGIAGLIRGTSSLEDVLDNFFNTILDGFLNNMLSSVFSGQGGLFGGLFGGGGGNKGGGDGLLGGLFGGSGGGIFDIFGDALGGGGGLLGGLFYKGGVAMPNYALGGVHQAMQKEAFESGRKPILAVVHSGELMIPADRVAELEKVGLSTDQLLGNYASGGVVGGLNRSASQTVDESRGSRNMTVSVESTVINNQEYVSIDQFREGMTQAAKAGAEQGFNRVQNKMSNSPSFRRSIGI